MLSALEIFVIRGFFNMQSRFAEDLEVARAAKALARATRRARYEALMFKQDLTHWVKEPGVSSET